MLTAAAGAVMALVTARLRGDYLAIITLGFSEVVRLVASNEIWLTNGTDGISGIPGPWRGQVDAGDLQPDLPGARRRGGGRGARRCCSACATRRTGACCAPIRDDDQVAAVAGKPVIAFKVEAFAVSAGVLGLAGALYGHYTSFIAPDGFVPLISIYIVLALTAGGTGNNYGAVLGAFARRLLHGVHALRDGRAAGPQARAGRGGARDPHRREPDRRAAASGPPALPARAHPRGGPRERGPGSIPSRTSPRSRRPSAHPGQPEATFRALDAALGAVLGHKLFTVLRYHEATRESERIYTNQPAAYPVGGRKPLSDTAWGAPGDRRAPCLHRTDGRRHPRASSSTTR